MRMWFNVLQGSSANAHNVRQCVFVFFHVHERVKCGQFSFTTINKSSENLLE